MSTNGFTNCVRSGGGKKIVIPTACVSNDNGKSNNHSLNEYHSHYSINRNLLSSVPRLCAHHTPSSYFATTGLFYQVYCLACLWHVFIFLTNAVPLIHYLLWFRGYFDPYNQLTCSFPPHLFCLPLPFWVVQYYAFLNCVRFLVCMTVTLQWYLNQSTLLLLSTLSVWSGFK